MASSADRRTGLGENPALTVNLENLGPKASVQANGRGELSDAARRLLPRLEGLGDNCEFGLVMRALGDRSTGLFRWSNASLGQVIAFLREDPSFYEFEDLTPKTPRMVTDLRVGFSFHSNLRSHQEEGGLVWEHDLEQRREIHRLEHALFVKLQHSFRERLRDPRTIFVVKRNANLSDEDIERLHSALRGRAATGRARLLAVRAADDPAQVGCAEIIGDDLFIGWVGRFAPYTRAQDAACEDWANMINDLAGQLDRRRLA